MAFISSTRRERSGGAIGAAAVTAGLGAVLALGLALHGERGGESPLRLFDVQPPRPEPVQKPRPHAVRSSRPEGAASPPNLRSEPTEIVAPPPRVPLPAPSSVVAAPIAGTGSDPSAGSADIAGPGTGSGGFGDGRGSGGDGDGDGGGGDETPPLRLRGDNRDFQYPEALADAGIGGMVGVRYTVWTDGRVRDCRIDRSSGNALLDATTCRMIEQQFRFRPSLDRRGRPVPSTVLENHSWGIEREPAERQPTPTRVRRRRWF